MDASYIPRGCIPLHASHVDVFFLPRGDEGEGSKSLSTPATPTIPSTSLSAKKDNVWRSVFNPGSNLATKDIGAAKFDKQEPNTPTVYDWLYSGETRSKHHC
ncbi:hypothetical protein QQ045_031619 [Rhodiola kirilowii]